MMLLLNIQTLGSCAIVTHVFSLIVGMYGRLFYFLHHFR